MFSNQKWCLKVRSNYCSVAAFTSLFSHIKTFMFKSCPTYITQVHPFSGTDIYAHMPILRPDAAQFHERCISSVTFTSAHLYGNVYILVGVARALTDSSDFLLLREQSSQKWEIPCLGRRWTAVQNVTLLPLSWAVKSVSVQTNKQTHSKRYIHTLPIGMCV